MNQSRYLPNIERQEQIARFIQDAQRASIVEICRRFQVSEATARRDLETLASQGKVRRTHGGAIALTPIPPELPVYQRLSDQSDEKDRIGREAACFVQDASSIFLGGGTTTLAAAQHLALRKDLTVITNSLVIANRLIEAPGIHLVILGGILRRSELSMVGHITEQALSELHVDKVLIGIHGIDLEVGLTNHSLQETMTDRAILQLSQEIVVLADHTKCGQVSTSLVAPISRVHTLITGVETCMEFTNALAAKGARVIRV